MSHGRAVLALSALGVALGLAPGAHAAEDGGTRSPFAAGAGCRALALGGAFVAIAEGPAGLTWNPAGLALERRSGFEMVHAGQGELGANDDFAAVVLPSWRWGSAALAVRHFGVGGIEPRDQRNVVVGEALSSSETEVTLGYARALSEAWSLGGAVKLQRQSLGEFGASALAADLGVLVNAGAALGRRMPWAEGFSAGLSIRNLLEPALRLDRESVRDPRVFRAGLAWRAAVGGGELRAALDLERSEAMTPRMHAGAELRLNPWFAVQGGLDHGRMTAGAEVSWRDLDVLYAFQDGDVGAAHRVGLSHPFGPTVDQSREAARRAEESALQSRLDEEFQRRRTQQLHGLLARAEEEIGRGSFAGALELLGAAATLDSSDARIRGLEARAANGLGLSLEKEGDLAAAAVAFARALSVAPSDPEAQAGQRRVREASEGRNARDAERRQRFDSGLQAFVAGNLESARAAFAALVARDPSDGESSAMLRRTEQAIAGRAAELLRQARGSLEAKAPEEAARLLARVRALDPRFSGLAELDSALARARGASRAPAVPPPAGTSVPGPAERREAEELFRRGTEALAARRTDDAVRFWELAISLDPSHLSARRYLNREYLVRGMDAYAAGRLDEAVDHWEKARRADPTDRRAAGFLERARERLERTREILGGDR